MADELGGRKVAILLAPVGSEQVEFTEPKKAVEEAGATVEVVGIEAGDAQTMNSDVNPGETFTVEKTFSEISTEDYDALIVPGGTVGADKLRGSEEVVTDQGLVTSRNPDDLPAFCAKVVEEFAEGQHEEQARSA
jgi:protease I